MSVLNFDKSQLGNLEYSLQRELLSTNRVGGYMSTTIVCCNTRKYHGLFVVPIDEERDKNYVLLSSLDETIRQHDQSFNLAIHRFPGVYEPRGHKYITDFVYTPVPTITYRVGGVRIRKELLWIHAASQLLIRYTLLDAHSETKLRLRPFLAFRENHALSEINMYANGYSYPIEGGVKNRLYDKFPWLHMQVSKEYEFVAVPDWYYNIEYSEEYSRGYPCHEDLLTTGYFEMDIKKGESIIFSCSIEEIEPRLLERNFEEELARRSTKTDFLSCLRHSARQFIVHHGKGKEVVAGYPWFGRWGRDTFIALPGITLAQGHVENCRAVINTMVSQMKDGLFPNMGNAYNSVDAPLWFFWMLQQFEKHTSREDVWDSYGEALKGIVAHYLKGIGEYIRVDANRLVWASCPTHAMTWMDAVVEGCTVTGRDGYQVEINALWYNAVCYILSLASEFGDEEFVKLHKELPEEIKRSFRSLFINKEGYLSDFVNDRGANNFIRPNQVIACALDNTMLAENETVSILNVIKQHLLTPKGLRTLSPRNPLYEGHYGGTQPERDRQYHQGTVWPWLLEHYVRANFNIYGAKFVYAAEDILEEFSEDISVAGIGSISEIYDGDPPHIPRGAISQAWSVGALLRINGMIEEYKK